MCLGLRNEKICNLVEQYAVTVVRGYDWAGAGSPRFKIIYPLNLEVIEAQGLLEDAVIEGMLLLLQKQFPHALGFQDPHSTDVQNFHKEFVNGRSIFEVLYKHPRHWVCCFATGAKLYLICSTNKRLDGGAKQRMASLFCDLTTKAPLQVECVQVQAQTAVECGCRAVSAGAFLLSGMGMPSFKKLEYPTLKVQYDDLRRCIVENEWCPQWAEEIIEQDRIVAAIAAKNGNPVPAEPAALADAFFQIAPLHQKAKKTVRYSHTHTQDRRRIYTYCNTVTEMPSCIKKRRRP